LWRLLKSPMSGFSKTKLAELADLVKYLAQLEYGVDYNIECRDRKAVVVFTKLQYYALSVRSTDHCIEISLSTLPENPCLMPSIQFVDDTDLSRRESEFKHLAVLYNILKCAGEVRLYIVLNTSSKHFIFLSHVLDKLRLESEKWSFSKVAKYALTALALKEYQSKAAKLASLLTSSFDERLREEYLRVVNEVDKLINIVKNWWLEDREVFEEVYSAVMSVEESVEDLYDKFSENPLSHYSKIHKASILWRREFSEVVRKLGLKPEFIDTLLDLNLRDDTLKALLERVVAYLIENKGCRHVIIVGPEAYRILLKSAVNAELFAVY